MVFIKENIEDFIKKKVVDKMGVDEMGVDEMGVDKMGEDEWEDTMNRTSHTG